MRRSMKDSDPAGLGAQGESYFFSRLSDYSPSFRATVNSPQRDMNGWDCIVEVEKADVPHLPTDLQPGKLDFFVQVKSAEKNQRTAKITLRNALHASKSPLPHFIAFIHYKSGRAESPTTYIKHIGEKEIAAWLRIARATDLSRKSKRTITIRFEDHEEVREAPLDHICRMIAGHGGDRYAERKITYAREIGYELHYSVVQIEANATPQEFEEHLVGMVSSISYRSLKIYGNRFGIPSLHPTATEDFGEVAISVPGKECTVIFRTDGGQTINFPGTLWKAPLVLSSSGLVRLKSGPLELVLDKDGLARRCRLRNESEKAKLLHEHLLQAWLKYWGSVGVVEVQVDIDGHRQSFGSIGSIEGNREEAARFYSVVSLIYRLAEREARLSLTLPHAELVTEINKKFTALLALSSYTKISSRDGVNLQGADMASYLGLSLSGYYLGGIFTKSAALSQRGSKPKAYMFHNSCEIADSCSGSASDTACEDELRNRYDSYLKTKRREIVSIERGNIAALGKKIRDREDFEITLYTPD
ncbi:DUF4365 domain-containing protein [Paracoccus liaowanqingii]|uniref:DUF4365 domain-containing protein n=2 Tax=Paracoccus liaowanqingii TaxID=2560053 RepID=A0A4Z1BKU4_9RHOB|nr:DUF4365 domain-containing protein [Paracoccus liaowanqingii]